MRLDLDRQEIDAILNILAERQFREVHLLIQKIMSQANEQLAQASARSNGQDVVTQPLQ